MHMHMFMECTQANPAKPQEPRQRDELPVGNVTNRAAKERQPW